MNYDPAKPPRPNVARMYDYFLGGKDHQPVDRAAADQVLARCPAASFIAMYNRRFLGRAVEFAVSQGIRQFIDIGAGLPTADNTHMIAQRAAPDSRIAYVDNDPVVGAFARAMMLDNDNVVMVQEDLWAPENILADPDLQRVIRLDEPVAILLVAILHFLPDVAKPWEIVDYLKKMVAPGSCLILSHGTSDKMTGDDIAELRDAYAETDAHGVTPRPVASVEQFFGGWDLTDPGLVTVDQWRAPAPEHWDHAPLPFYAGVAVKPS